MLQGTFGTKAERRKGLLAVLTADGTGPSGVLISGVSLSFGPSLAWVSLFTSLPPT